MDVQKCLIIKTIAEEKSITKAAEKLHMTQPALSYKLKALEVEIGIPLFVRAVKGVTLTEPGAFVLEYALDNLKRYERLSADIRNTKTNSKNCIRVGVYGMYAYDEFKDILRIFKKRYEDIEVLLRVDINSKIIEWFNTGELDIAVVVNDNLIKEHSRFLINGNAYVMYNKPFELSELENMDRVLYMPKSKEIKDVLNKWWDEHYDKPYKVGVGVDDIDLLYQSVKNGLGWASMSSVSRKYWLEDFTYKQLFFKNGDKVTYPICLVYNEHSIKHHSVRAFCNELLNWYDQPGI